MFWERTRRVNNLKYGGASSDVFRSFDGGENWEEQSSGTENQLYDVFCLDQLSGFVVGENGLLLCTFDGGESFMIRNGELAEPVRGVVISGAILDTLKTVDAVGNDLELATGYFGACGKGGQAVKVGFGGPHIRVQEMTVGGK